MEPGQPSRSRSAFGRWGHRLLLLLVLLPAALTASPLRLGDLDEDGVPTVIDLVRLINHLNGTPPLEGGLVPFADLNEDGLVDHSDVDLLADAILEINPLPNPYAPPVLATPVIGTNGPNVLLTGTARPHRTILVEGGLSLVEVEADANGDFSVTVPLQPNRINHLFVTASNQFFTAGTPQPLRIIQDVEPPSLFIDFPAADQTLTDSNAVIAGRVGDMLSGFMGLEVVVEAIAMETAPMQTNAGPANVNVGIGNNGTFERSLVLPGEGTNLIVVTATDEWGNATSRELTLVYRPLIGGPWIEVQSGNLQQARVGQQLIEPVVVRVKGADGSSPFVGKLVNFEVIRSNGRLSPVDREQSATDLSLAVDRATGGTALLQVFTDDAGEARVWWTLGSDAGCGNNRMRVSSVGVSNEVYFCASAQANPVRQINVGGGQNQKAETGGFTPEPLRAWVSDACNGVENIPVTFTVVRGGGRLFPVDALAGEGATSLTVPSTRTGHTELWLRLGPGADQNIVEATYPGNPGRPATFFAYGVQRSASGATRFTGLVLDNSAQPIGGAEVRLASRSGELTTTSDDQGRFAFNDAPPGPAHLHVNGLVATSLGGDTVPTNIFPGLTFATILIPQAENSLPTPVLLPCLNTNNTQLYPGTNDLVLTCEGMAGLQMTIRANSMRHPDGSPVTPQNPARVSLNQVHHDEVPMPMPDGASPPFAWTLQPGGATFDPPVTIQYPNMSGLPAGAIAYFLSFNHDTERFEIVASGQVSKDGSRIVTDPGAGLTVAGWGCNCPPYSATCEMESCPTDAEPLAAGLRLAETECCPIELQGPTVLSTNGSIIITATGGEVTWRVLQPGGQVVFIPTTHQITLEAMKESLAVQDVIVQAFLLGHQECMVEHRVTVVSAGFMPVAPCCGYDDSMADHWLMAPVVGMNKAQLVVTPTDAVSLVELKSLDTGVATVSPTTPNASPQEVNVMGVSHAETEVQAKLQETGEMLAKLKISAKNRTSWQVVIHAITDTNRNLVPTRVPTQAALQAYLNDQIWGKQANVHFTVTRTDFDVAYDVNTNGVCDRPVPGMISDEEVLIIQDAADISSPDTINVFFVHAYSVQGTSANAAATQAFPPLGPTIFIQDSHDNSPENITAHELGHGIGLDQGAVPYHNPDSQYLMFQSSLSSNPCEISKDEWDKVNP